MAGRCIELVSICFHIIVGGLDDLKVNDTAKVTEECCFHFIIINLGKLKKDKGN